MEMLRACHNGGAPAALSNRATAFSRNVSRSALFPALTPKIARAPFCRAAPSRDRSVPVGAATNKKDQAMFTLRALLIFCARMLAAAGAAFAALMLGWIITAHAANPLPDDADRPNPVLCERGADAICPPDLPGLMSKPATLVIPQKAGKFRAAARAHAGRLTKF